ncbi:hypothetical protein, partial [Bowmanella yangjiangensis]
MRATNYDQVLPVKRVLATAIGLAIASLTLPALADESLKLDSVTVKGEQEGDYKTESVSSPKYTAPLLD